jgi:hypothetical protein
MTQEGMSAALLTSLTETWRFSDKSEILRFAQNDNGSTLER